MRQIRLLAAAILLATVPHATAANLTITPTTTLAAETANNTSTAESFVTSTNGNLGAGNVSKQPLRDLVYPGFAGQVYVNWVPWWGSASHVNIGYNSADIAQIDRQITDMMSRGIDGLIVDWWHAGSIENATTQMMYRAELFPPFKFALMYDASQLGGLSDPTQRLINDLNYATQHYYTSSAYLKIGGRPVLLEFGLELYPIDWTRVQQGVTGNPLWIFRNVGGYARPMSSGAFAWGASDTGTSYLDYFYSKSLGYPATKFTWGAAAKGFDDSLAAWGQHRFASQQCGQHWLAQLADAGKYYASQPTLLDAMQIATWNDYEEGTAIETGIDNCVTLSASVAGSNLSWAITGMENTVHHYRVFISADGVNLMALADVPTGTHSFDLSKFSLAPGTYTLYVKAIGQASLRNQMSPGVTYSVGNRAPIAALTVTPGAGIAPVMVSASTAGSTDPDGSPVTSTIDFGDGAKASGPIATHTYSAAGNYTVTAVVTDPQGLSSSANAPVAVAANQPPLATLSLSPGNGVAPVTVTASTAGSSDPDGSIASSTIDFGDGTKAAGPTASHSYGVAGSYMVTANVTDNKGATSTTSGTVTVNAAGVTVVTPIAGTTTTSPVRVVASAASGNGISATWIYLDGVAVYKINSASVDASVAMPAGNHSMVVQAWDTKGTVFKAPVALTINAPPVAALSVTPSAAYAPMTVTASTAASTDLTGTITGSVIDFGDGTIVAGTTASHSYSTGGVYNVKATVTDSFGASSSTSTYVTVYAPKVTLTSPLNGSRVGQWTHVVASATSGAPVSAMWIYLDNDVVYKTNASSLDVYIKTPGGTHTLTVKAWDSTGTLFKAAATVTR